MSPDSWMAGLKNQRWKEEVPTPEDFARAQYNFVHTSGIDIMLFHDAPEGVPVRSGLNYTMPANLDADARETRRQLRFLVDEFNPEYVFHGHWHQALESVLNGYSDAIPTKVYSVANVESEAKASMILDLTENTVEWGDPVGLPN